MPISEAVMEQGEWSVGLKPDTPTSVLDAIDVRTYAFASIVITPQWHRPGDLSDANLLAQSRFTGVYLAQTDGRLNLEGASLDWWLGDENDGGNLYTGVDGTSADLDLEDQLDARIFTSFANGLTKGTVDSLATLRTIKTEGGTTRRAFLDAICSLYPSGPYEWRVNPDGSVDVNQQADLYPTSSTPTAVLTLEGGREGALNGLHAELDLDSVDASDWRSQVTVAWDDAAGGANYGSASNTPPTNWVDFAGGAPDVKTQNDWQPRVSFRERRRWSLRVTANKFAAWVVNSQTQANQLATRHANQTNSYSIDVTAHIDEYDPWRYIEVGDSVYVYDQELGLVDTANEAYYRGSVIHPQKLRVHGWTTPILEGYGVYLRRWTGAAFDYYDLTPYVEFEEDDTTLDLGTRARFHRRGARPKPFNKRRLRRQARRRWKLKKYFDSV